MDREMNLKTPKHSVDSATLKVVLGIYYQANDWLENSAYIEQARNELQKAELDTGNKEPQSYTKKMQILTYYGFICWEDDSSMSRRKITDLGKNFYQVWMNDDADGMVQIILQSLKQTVFGRNNNGIPDSDSDVEVPCLALRACIDLGKLTSLIYAYLIQKIQNHGYSYTQVIQEIKGRNYQIDANEIEPSCNKYKDWKPISFLKDVGLFEEVSHEYIVPQAVLEKYGKIIGSLPIFNVDKFMAEDLVLPKMKHSKIIVTSSQNSSHISSYLLALRSKPFMLLAGISGTGKSRIVRKLAQATVTEELQRANGYTGDDFANDRWTLHSPANFELIQVKPNWHNSMDVIGYLSNIPSPHYVFTPFIEFIVKAWQHPKVPFFLCLDEMNLAPVEEYFAEFLSAIESRSFEDKKYITDPIIKPFNSFGSAKNEKGAEINVGDMMINTLFPNFKASDTDSEATNVIKHFRTKGLTLPKNLIVIGTVNMDETTFSFSRKVLDRAMSVEMNEVNYDSFLTDTVDDDLKAIVKAFEEKGDTDLNALLVDRHIEAKEIIEELGEDAQFAIDYLKRINALLEGTPFKLGYRAANEALIYLQASHEFGQTDRIAALDNFTQMKILSRIEGDETKLKITDSEADKERIANACVNVDAAKQYGDLNILTALRNIITQMLGESDNADLESNVTEETATESRKEMISTEQQKKKKELQSIKKIDSMLSQLKRDHFVSFWN